jgi:hypothetical protein
MTKEEKKVLMRALWDSLLEPKWTKDDLIDFGKAVFSKKTLKEMDDKTFNKLFPFLEQVTNNLGRRLQAEAEKMVAAKKTEGESSMREPETPATQEASTDK